ncbi:metal-dependent hydrolase [Halorubellus sp. PRR65]|uniref:metal-dependent hydrolase n=1 Tax=Halorubellus sp. PRR65 TaxID=3098148 RepID=UPI002B261693|nr:metal-dependent hydrolase [Halorubellus sp. PRR65]
MWPWEHAAIGYVCYSAASRLLAGEPPDGDPVLFLAVGTQFPDLVDKPLSWWLGVFPTGYAAGHSVLVLLAVTLLALGLVRDEARRRNAVAFLVGAWTHVAGDVVSPLRAGDSLGVDRVLWPVVERPPYADDLGLERGVVYLREFLSDLGTVDVGPVLVLTLALAVASVLLWLVDGAPGVRALAARIERTTRSRRER